MYRQGNNSVKQGICIAFLPVYLFENKMGIISSYFSQSGKPNKVGEYWFSVSIQDLDSLLYQDFGDTSD